MLNSGRRALFLTVSLIVVTVVVYYPVRYFPFINYDDDLYVTENVHVQSGVEWDTVQWAFTTYHASNWHPLTWLSHALDAQLFGMAPAGPHLINLLLHVLNVVLLFWVLLLATGFAGRSAMVAALFALHPINVQSVAWVAERKNLLSMLFFLLALGAYGWYSRRTRDPFRRSWDGQQISRYAVVAMLFVLGLMAKPQIVTLPLILLLWDYWPLRRMIPTDGGEPTNRFSRLVWEKLPLLALSAASAVITVLAHSAGGGVRWLPLSVRIANAIVSYVRYTALAFWPSGLAVFYPHPLVSLRSWNVLAAFLFLAAMTWLVVAERRRQFLLVGWFWFLITLLPMIGIVQVGTQGMADRYAYLPLVGLFIMVSWAVAEWADRRHVPVFLQAAIGAVVLLALSIATYRQLTYWHDSVTLWTHTLEVTNGNYIAEVDLGAALLQRGEIAQAMEHFRAATAIEPSDPLGNMYIARYAQMQNHLAEAIEAYKKVIAATRDSSLKARAFSNMGHAYRALGNEADAEKCFHAAAELGY